MNVKNGFCFVPLFLFSLLFFSCHFFTSFIETEEHKVNSIEFDKYSLEMSVGSMDIINVTISSTFGQNKENVNWSYDESIISATKDNYSIVITAIKAGTTIIKASCGDKSTQCALTVSSNEAGTKIENPYVYVSSDYVNIAPGETEKVYASIYGGTVSDKNGFTFTSDKPGIASVYVEGNYCWITGKSEGLAKITCKHSKCSYGYSFLVAVTASSLDVPYITTSNNILTINKSTESSKSFTVDLRNSTYTTYKDDFTFSVVDDDGNIMSEPNVSISATANKVTVTPLKSGACYVKVGHPSASYDFNVLVRIVENLETAYIEPSSAYVVVNGSTSETVELSIADLPAGISVDNDKFEWSFSDNAEDYLDYSIYNGSESGKGNTVWLTGKKNGAVKITVSHPLCSSTRSILILVRNIVSDASSSKVYITTSQNYIETKVGADDTRININVNNISSGENDIEWEILNDAADGSSDPVIMYTGGTGKSSSRFISRSAISMSNGYAYITPLKEGKATITISHPKAAYSTKILVNVLASDSVSVEPLVLSTENPFVQIKNGETESISVTLTGATKEAGDDSNIVWTCSDSSFTVSANGASANITANGTGLNKITLQVSHEKASYPLNIILVSYDDSSDLENLKALYTFQNSYIIYTEDQINIYVTTVSYSDSQSIGTDENGNEITYNNLSEIDANVSWTVTKGLNETIGFTEYGNSATITGIGAGTAEISACLTDNPSEKVIFYINVKQDGKIDDSKPTYLTTSYNVVTTSVGNTEDINITPVNISGTKYDEIVWTNKNPELFSLSSNGINATITALKEGSGIIEISHPLSNNTLTLTIHVGNEYVYSNTDVCYISSDDTVTLTTKSEDIMFYAVLCHTESSLTETKGFTFSSSDTSIFTVNYSSDKNYCYIKPKKAGQGTLKIHHSDAEYDKEVLVIIQKTAAELADIPYISTSQNVATIVQGEYATLTVALKNDKNYEASNWTWSSSNGNISDVVVNSGTTAMISGVNPGTTKITVSHSDCLYPLEIIVICLDSNSVSSNPFIHTSSNIVTLSKGKSTTVTADMTGGSAADDTAFIWTIADSSVALISNGSGSCYIKGLKAGQTYITVRNTNYPDAYSKTVFVRVEDTTVEDCYITVTSKVLKINPSDTSGETITATLENGAVLDAQDFVWWADDYNIVSLSAITDTARIVPTGVSGTTYVHVKHPKVVTTVDILVMCSEYTEFSFKYLSKDILEKSILFVPMEVPVTSEESWIEYESSNNNVVVATGSNQVCMIAGVMQGVANITATLKTENGTVGTSQMAVIVNKADETINTISMNSTVINMEIGESQTLEALLSGNSISTNDYYNLEWSLTSNENSCISLLQNEAGKTTGKNSYITAKAGGTAVLTLSHPLCSYNLSVWVIVPEKEETDISLNQTYIEMYKSDGSATVTAKLINGSSTDASTVTWTAPKVGGVNIVSISKSNGLTCNIIPRNVGSTTLRAQLPNGNYADCIVTVLTDAEIVLETKTVHVNPGFTETVNYTVTPENATINWIEMMNGSASFGTENDFFDFSVNESTKTITIIGKELGSGIIYGYSANDSGTSKAQLSVICEYNYVLEFDGADGIITMHPDDSGLVTSKNSPHNLAEIPFHVYPKSGMDLNITSSDPAIEISSYSYDSSKGTGLIYVKALTEEIGGYITLTATNPDDKLNTPISRKKYIDSYYGKYTINPVFNFGAGSFSHYEANNSTGNVGTLYLGDGESYSFYLDVAEPNAKLSNITVTYKPGNNCDTKIGEDTCFDNEEDQYNNGSGSSKPHIFFTGNKSTGELWPETTASNDVQYYKIGHNYDYTKMGYLTSGNCKINQTPSQLVCGDFHIKKTTVGWTYPDADSLNIWQAWGWPTCYLNTNNNSYIIKNDYLQINYNNEDTKEKFETPFYSEEDISDLVRTQIRSLATRLDNNFYYYPSLGSKYSATSNQSHILFYNKHLYKTYSYSVNYLELYPTYLGQTVCKDIDTVERYYANLVISYKDVKGVNSSDIENQEKTIKVIVEKRYCPNNINGMWEQTTDANGIKCWKCISKDAKLPAYIESKFLNESANTTNEYQINSNVSLNSSNTKIIPEDSSNSLITLSLLSNNKIKITTGDKQFYTDILLKKEYYELFNGTELEDLPDPEEEPEYFEVVKEPIQVTNSFIIEYYENNKKITSGKITVIYN